MNKKLTSLTVIGVALSMITTAMAAGSQSGAMAVSATIGSGCSVSSASMTFPAINPLTDEDVVADTAGSLMIACTAGTSPLIWSDADRVLSNGASTITFSLGQTPAAALTDALPKIVAGQAIAAPFVANGIEQSVPLHGLIKAAAYNGKAAGIYTASVMINVNY